MEGAGAGAVRSAKRGAERRAAPQVSYGGVRAVMDMQGAKHLLVDPYLTLVVLGSLLMPLSGLGFWAAVVSARRTLFLYFCGCLLAATVLVYVSALCFLYASSDTYTSQLVAAYWDLTQAALQQESTLYDTSHARTAASAAGKLLGNAGRMCAAAAVLLFVALFCASRVAGHAWMLSRVGLAQNLLTTALGAAVVYMATITSRYNLGGDWAADFIGGVGGFIMLLSVGGALAMACHWRAFLWLHFVSLFLLSLLLMAATVLLLVYGSARVSSFARTSAGKVPAVFRARVLGCAAAQLPAPQPNSTQVNGTAGLEQLNLTSAGAAAVLQCALTPEAAERWWEAHLTYLGALGAVLLVTLMCNLVATGYLLYTGGADDDEEGDAGPRRRRKDKRRRRRRRDTSEDSSSDGGDVQLTRRSSKRAAEEEEP